MPELDGTDAFNNVIDRMVDAENRAHALKSELEAMNTAGVAMLGVLRDIVRGVAVDATRINEVIAAAKKAFDEISF